MRIQVLSRNRIKTVDPTERFIIVSINDAPQFHLDFKHKNLVAVHYQDYHDTTENYPGKFCLNLDHTSSPCKLVSDADSIALLRFLEAHRSVPELYVHCNAGRCRSPATAAAIDEIFNGTDPTLLWFQDHNYNPNMLVYRSIIRAAYTLGYFPGTA